MVEFQIGYWNLKELELIEVEKGKLKCYLSEDVDRLKRKLIDDILKQGIGKYNKKIIIQKLNERFG